MSATFFLALRILLAVCLYAFLAVALYTLWRDLRQRATQPATSELRRITLVLEDQAGEMRTYPLVGNHQVIGRDPVCDLYLEDSTLSARHAKLSFHHSQWWLEDLNSTNGTFLNTEQVYEPVVLTDGDQIGCGKISLRISSVE